MKIPGYDIMRPIATGGSSTVFLAVQHSLGRQVVLKILRKGDDSTYASRFVEEGRVVASLSHRNVITVHDIGVTEHWYYIAMEYLKGGSLEDRIREGMSLSAILDVMDTVTGCLDFLHKRGIIHRDVKPANILFHEDGTPKLTDFGIAKQVARDQDLTMDGMALGSPYYLSPEQAGARPVDGRSDIYSLGIVFYEMLTGEKPFRGDSHVETMMAQINQPVPQLPAVFAVFQEMLERMIAKDPVERFASVAELRGYIQAMRRFADGGGATSESLLALPEPSEATYAATGKSRRSVRKVAAGALAAVGAFAIVTLVLMAPGRELASGGPSGGASAAGVPPSAYITDDRPATTVAEEQPVTVMANEQSATAVAGEQSVIEAAGELPVTTMAGEESGLPEAAAENPADAGAISMVVPEPAVNPVNSLAGADQPQDRVSDADQASTAPADSDPDPEVGAEVEQWLSQARLAMEDLRLTTPSGNNAYDLYRQVLAVEPDNVEASRGLGAIANVYSALARKQMDGADLVAAARYVDRGLQVRPRHGELLAMRRELDDRKQAQEEVASPSGTESGFFSRLFGGSPSQERPQRSWLDQ